MNTEQLARFLSALERIADALEKPQPVPPSLAAVLAGYLQTDDQIVSQQEARRRYGMPPVTDTDTPTTKGPYR